MSAIPCPTSHSRECTIPGQESVKRSAARPLAPDAGDQQAITLPFVDESERPAAVPGCTRLSTFAQIRCRVHADDQLRVPSCLLRDSFLHQQNHVPHIGKCGTSTPWHICARVVPGSTVPDTSTYPHRPGRTTFARGHKSHTAALAMTETECVHWGGVEV